MPDRTDTRIVESPIAATWRSIQHEKAVLVGIGPGIAEEDLDELAALADSAGAEPVEHRGSVPAGAIVVPGSRAKAFPAGTYGMPCGLIIGDRTEATDDKVALNELLREAGSSMG